MRISLTTLANEGIRLSAIRGIMRFAKVALWTLIVFLLSPSKAAAVAYCLLGGFLVLSVGLVLIILGFSWKGITKIFPSLNSKGGWFY